MSIKITLIFVVLLAVSFVHSFAKLTGGNDVNVRISKLMSLMQNLNATYTKEKLKDKSDVSGGSGEAVNGYIDMIFDAFFDGDDSSVDDTDLAFGPEFDPELFVSLLSNDIDKAFQRKCKKISGSDDTYSKVKAASKELGQCMKNFVKSEEMRTADSNFHSQGDIASLIKTLCRKRHGPFKCVDNYMEIDAQCSFPREIEIDNSIRRIVYGVFDVTCENDGNDFISLITGQGRQCLLDNLDELKTCQYKELYAIVKGLVVKLIENETFEFKMDAEDCKALDEARHCFVAAVDNCADATQKNYVAAYYQVFYNETICAKITPLN